MDPIQQIVRQIVKARYEDLSSAVVEVVKKSILDTMGAAIAGSSAPAGIAVTEVVRDWGGRKDGTLAVYGGKVPVQGAILANTTMARCLELDDMHEGGGGHVSVNVVPASLVVAEWTKSHVSGKDLILAIALGSELVCRMRLAAGRNLKIGWPTESFAAFGVVACAGKMLGLNEEQILNGMGIAYNSFGGTNQAVADGTWALWLIPGTGGAGGITSVELARKGFVGTRNPLLGIFGLYPLYFRGEYDEKKLLDGFGDRWEIVDISIKPYPSCKLTHHAIYTTIGLVEKHDIRPEDVEAITVKRANSFTAKIVCFDDRGELKHSPRRPSEAQFSLPYTMANAVVKRRLTLEDITDKAITDPGVLAISSKVKVEVDSSRDSETAQTAPVEVEIRVKGGKVFSGCEEFVKGHPRNPMSMAECIDKFKYCASYAEKPLPEKNLSVFIDKVRNLEEERNVTALMQYLC